MAKVPVEVSERSGNPFGEEVDESVLTENPRDVFYIEGYSDRRQQYEAAVARGEHPDPLPFRLQGATAQTSEGRPMGKKIAEWKAMGYKVLTWEMAKKLGLNVGDSSADHGEGDAVVIGDQVMMVADAKVAATHWQRNQQAIKSQHERFVEAPMRDAVEKYNRNQGRKRGSAGATDTIFEVDLQGETK